MSDGLTSKYASALRIDESYRCQAILKSSSYETTQKVMLETIEGVEFGPYIRKYLNKELGLGATYHYLYELQKKGRRFKYLPTIVDYYELDNWNVVITEFVPGLSLDEFFSQTNNRRDTTCHFFPGICEAVLELHESFDNPIIHRDIKPSNILINSEQVVLIDFGIARRYVPQLAQDTHNFGTRLYAPPEQFGYGQTNIRSDVYALGMLLCYCLAHPGQLTKRPETSVDLQALGVPVAFHQVILKATAFDPRFRYDSVRSLKDDFLSAVAQDANAQANPIQATDKDMNQSISSWSQPQKPPFESFSSQDAVAAPGIRDRLRGALASVPHTIGRIWNIVVGLCWLVIIAACISSVVSPQGEIAAWSIEHRALFVAIFMIPFFSLIGYILLDKRRIKKRIRFLDVSFGVEVLGSVVFLLIIFVLYFIVALIFGIA